MSSSIIWSNSNEPTPPSDVRSVSQTKFDKVWSQNGEVDPAALFSARSYADWLGLWFAQHCSIAGVEASQGQNALLRWAIHDDTKLLVPAAEPGAEGASTEAGPAADPDQPHCDPTSGSETPLR